jgi:hypothetical protein
MLIPDDQEPILQFGKCSMTRYVLDFKFPLSPLQAFGIALASFANDELDDARRQQQQQDEDYEDYNDEGRYNDYAITRNGHNEATDLDDDCQFDFT